jgi:hypothetical protein
MKNKAQLDDELKGISPFLQDLKKKPDGRKTPAGYFDQLEDSVYKKIAESGVKRPGAMPKSNAKGLFASYLKPRNLMTIAAAMVLLFSAFWFLKPTQVVEPTQVVAVDLSEKELEDYMLEHIHDFDSEQLATLPDADFSASTHHNAGETNENAKKHHEQDFKPEDISPVLDEMSDEELEELL